MKKIVRSVSILTLWGLVLLLLAYTASALEIPEELETLHGEDGSRWERVNQPGFGTKENVGIVALCPYGGSLYALTRNDTSGFELWRTEGTGWSKVIVPGLTDNQGFYGWLKPGAYAEQYDTQFNLKQNIWGDLIEFNGMLYVAVSTGYQGAQLYGSLGCEIWRFDGTTWEGVVSAVNCEEMGVITGIADCTSGDSAFTARLTDSSKSWAVNQWAGCLLRVEGAFEGSEGTLAGTPGLRIFKIEENDGNTLTVQQNEMAGIDEYTICGEHRLRIPGDFGRPDSVVPAIAVGDSYTIMCGTDGPGFGEIWNKTIVDMEILNGELYATIGLNYQDGTRVWKTSNGRDWVPASEYSFGLFHGYHPGQYPGNPGGNPVVELDPCVLSGLEEREGNPVCSSSTRLGKSSVTGKETLFTGGTGTSGCNGRGARVMRLEGSEWKFIVDYFVDENDTGTNENGFGVSGEFQTCNFQAWSWAEYDSRLFVSVIRLKGGSRVMSTESGSEVDGAWVYAVGGDHPTYSDGFGDVTNIGSYLFVFDDALYAGSISDVGFNEVAVNGADLWKGSGPGTSLDWVRVTGDGFGDENIVQFEAFTDFGGDMYVAGSNLISSRVKGEEPSGYSGAKIFRLEGGGPPPSTTTAVTSSTTTGPGPCLAEKLYGEHSEETMLLRWLRDEVLSGSPQGKEIIRLYYSAGPALSGYMDEDHNFKKRVEEFFTHLLSLIRDTHPDP